MRVVAEHFERRVQVSHVPEARATVVSAARQVVLPVGVKVKVAHHLAVCVLDHVHLPVSEDASRMKKTMSLNRLIHMLFE